MFLQLSHFFYYNSPQDLAPLLTAKNAPSAVSRPKVQTSGLRDSSSASISLCLIGELIYTPAVGKWT